MEFVPEQESLMSRIPTCLLALALTSVSVFAVDPPITDAPSKENEAPGDAKPQVDKSAKPDRPAVMIPDSVHLERDVRYATAKDDSGKDVDLLFDAMFLKKSDKQRIPVIVYIHGGGFTSGAKEDGIPECVPFALGGYFVATINHRLAPASKFPAAVHDCKAAVRFLRKNAESLGIDPNRIGVVGRSAGGYLALMLATSWNSPDIEGEVGVTDVPSAVQAVVAFSAPTDFATLHLGWGEGAAPTVDHKSPDSFSRVFLGGDPIEDRSLNDRSSIFTYIDKADAPVYLVHGEADSLVPSKQSMDLRDIMEVRGEECTLKRLPGGTHDLRGPRILLDAAKFFDEKLGGNSVDIVKNMGKRRGG